MNFLKKLFGKKSDSVQEEPVTSNKSSITLADVQQFDDVCIKINDQMFEGWIVEKTNSTVNVVYTDNNKKLHVENFKLERPLNRTELEQNGKTLILK